MRHARQIALTEVWLTERANALQAALPHIMERHDVAVMVGRVIALAGFLLLLVGYWQGWGDGIGNGIGIGIGIGRVAMRNTVRDRVRHRVQGTVQDEGQDAGESAGMAESTSTVRDTEQRPICPKCKRYRGVRWRVRAQEFTCSLCGHTWKEGQ